MAAYAPTECKQHSRSFHCQQIIVYFITRKLWFGGEYKTLPNVYDATFCGNNVNVSSGNTGC